MSQSIHNEMASELHASGPFYSSFLFRGCGFCHTCGAKLSLQSYCSKCKKTRRYICHGYTADDTDSTPCLNKGIIYKSD
jgi:hypothetical protein